MDYAQLLFCGKINLNLNMLIARHRHELSAAQMLRLALRRDDLRVDVERQMQELLGVPYALLLPSGRAAIYWALRAAPEKVVYVPAFTCFVVVEAAQLAGKDVRFVDIDPATYNARRADYEDVIEPGGIVLATEQFGFTGELREVCALARELGCKVLEDSAGGLGGRLGGRPLGSFGDLAIFSFQYTKTASGRNAGMVAGSDAEWFARTEELWLAEGNLNGGDAGSAAFLLAFAAACHPFAYGAAFRGATLLRRNRKGAAPHIAERLDRRMYLQRPPDYETRLIAQGLARLDEIRRGRQRIMQTYRASLCDCPGIVLPPDEPETEVVPIRYPVRLTQMTKEVFHQRMLAQGCDLGFSFDYTCVPPDDEGRFPGAATAARQVVNLPIYSRLGDGAATVVAAVRAALGAGPIKT